MRYDNITTENEHRELPPIQRKRGRPPKNRQKRDYQDPNAKVKKHKDYFTQQTEDSILKYQQENDQSKKHIIFVNEIKGAFDKLVENLIFVYHFHTIGPVEILKSDCVSALYENIHKFNGTRGHKAFSYFNVIAKNWFIQRVKVHKKKFANLVHLDKDLVNFLEKNNERIQIKPAEDSLIDIEFFELLKDDIKTYWYQTFHREQERKVLDAVMLLLENPDMPTLYNKKAIYLFLREMTNLSTKQIVTNLVKFRRFYNELKGQYMDGNF